MLPHRKKGMSTQRVPDCSEGVVLISPFSSMLTGLATPLPRRTKFRNKSGTARQASDGRKSPSMTARGVVAGHIYNPAPMRAEAVLLTRLS